MRRGITLIEILVVLVIIAMLATLGMPAYQRNRENTLDKEATANLKLVRAAQRIYRMESDVYAECADISAINNWLRLSLSSNNWSYKVTPVDNATVPPTFTAKARRTGYDNRLWCITESTDDPYQSGCTW